MWFLDCGNAIVTCRTAVFCPYRDPLHPSCAALPVYIVIGYHWPPLLSTRVTQQLL
jgi:hypothetical protein